MKDKKIIEAIRKICGGEHEDFQEQKVPSCKFYNASNQECEVLCSRKVPDVTSDDHERCMSIIMYFAKVLLEDKWKRGREITDHEELDFGALIGRLHTKSLKGFDLQKSQRYDLEFWYRYVRRSVYRAIAERVRDLRVLPHDKECGTCVHLPSLGPFHCRLRDIRDKKTKKKYRNPFFRRERKTVDAGCPGYKPKTISLRDLPAKEASYISDATERGDGVEDSLITRVDLSTLINDLTEKIRDPTTGDKERGLLRRRRTLIFDLYHLAHLDISEDKLGRELRKRKTDDLKERDALRKLMEDDLKWLKDFYQSRK